VSGVFDRQQAPLVIGPTHRASGGRPDRFHCVGKLQLKRPILSALLNHAILDRQRLLTLDDVRSRRFGVGAPQPGHKGIKRARLQGRRPRRLAVRVGLDQIIEPFPGLGGDLLLDPQSHERGLFLHLANACRQNRIREDLSVAHVSRSQLA
jgi:hypothetical protein